MTFRVYPETFSILTAEDEQLLLSFPMTMISLRGIGMPTYEYHTVIAPQQHGQTLIETLARPRNFALVVSVSGVGGPSRDLWTLRQELISRLNPFVGELIFRVGMSNCLVYELRHVVVSTGFDEGLDTGQDPYRQRLALQFIANDPVWYGTAHELTEYSPGGIWGEDLLCYNAGNFYAYPYITVTGPLTELVLRIVEIDARIELNGVTLGGGESVFISTAFGSRLVLDDAGNNVALTNDSTLSAFNFGFAPIRAGGLNTLHVIAVGTTMATGVSVEWNDRVLGI